MRPGAGDAANQRRRVSAFSVTVLLALLVSPAAFASVTVAFDRTRRLSFRIDAELVRASKRHGPGRRTPGASSDGLKLVGDLGRTQLHGASTLLAHPSDDDDRSPTVGGWLPAEP